jgi:excisionase family DNA binding protein
MDEKYERMWKNIMDLITVEEVASKLRVKKSWVYTHANGIGVYRLGKYLRFSWPRVLECLDMKRRSSGLPHYDLAQTPENTADKIGKEQS